MTTDRKSICKCGNAISELLSDIDQLRKNIKSFRFEDTKNMDIKKIRTSIFKNFDLIHNVDENCGIDTREERNFSDENFIEAVHLVDSSNLSTFSVHHGTLTANMDKIKSGIERKIKDCSK